MRQLDESLRRLQDRPPRPLADPRGVFDERSGAHFANGGVIEALDEAQAAGQGALRRLHRPQGSGAPPARCCRTTTRSTPCRCRSTASTRSSAASSSGCCPKLIRQGIAAIGMKRLGGDARRSRSGPSRPTSAPLHDEPADRDARHRHRLDASAAPEPRRRARVPADGALEMQALRRYVAGLAVDGRFELYKIGISFDGDESRREHGLPPPLRVDGCRLRVD